MDPTLSSLSIDCNDPPESVATQWLDALRSNVAMPPESQANGFKEALILRHLILDRLEPGHIISTLTVKPFITNRYNTFHGGAVATIASIMGLLAVKTIAGNREFVQTEMSMSYLQAARNG
ncbi:hypothetical protein KI387_018971, partial [Taxus chinensis]